MNRPSQFPSTADRRFFYAYAPGHIEYERSGGMSDWEFRAEYLCEFVDDNEAFFSSELVDAMIDNTIEAWA